MTISYPTKFQKLKKLLKKWKEKTMENKLAVAGQFLPAGYEEPKTSRYMRLQMGRNVFRVLSPAIVGREYWKTGEEGSRKPVRVHLDVKIPIDDLEENPQTGDLDMPKVFWAFPVWNYADGRVQILHLTQKTIRLAMKLYTENPKWGDQTTYDFVVERMIEGGKTSYQVTVEPKSPIPQEALDEFEHLYINLNALYDGSDPFKPVEDQQDDESQKLADEVDQGISEQKELKMVSPYVRRPYGKK